MIGKILVITEPDDSFLQGIRITHVNLSQAQSQIVSQGLLSIQPHQNIINYVWQQGQSVPWLLNVCGKSDIILFNADDYRLESMQLIGYFAANHKSYYFGTLRDLHLVNDRVLLNSKDVITLVENLLENE